MKAEKAFVEATRRNLFFKGVAGNYNITDLWTLGLRILNEMAQDYYRKMQDKQDVPDYLGEVKPVNEDDLIRHTVLVYIIKYRQAEAAKEHEAAAKSIRLQELLKAKHRIGQKAIEDMSEEEVDAAIAELSKT